MPIPDGLTLDDWLDMPRSMRNAISRKEARARSISQDHGHEDCDDCEFARSAESPIQDYRDLPFNPRRL